MVSFVSSVDLMKEIGKTSLGGTQISTLATRT
jgi:hypothetical protein